MHIYISYSSIDLETQLNLRTEVRNALLKEAKEEGVQQRERTWYNPQPKSWQEAYIRSYSINWRYYEDYEKNRPDAEVPKLEDWEAWLNQHLDDKAETALAAAINDLEIEVVI